MIRKLFEIMADDEMKKILLSLQLEHLVESFEGKLLFIFIVSEKKIRQKC